MIWMMSEYRRAYVPGGTFFLTWVTYQRQPLFADRANIVLLRQAVATTKKERPFDILGAVILPDHLHFLWTLPQEDFDYSQRVSRIKTVFTRLLRGRGTKPQNISVSRRKHRESDVWQRRFWEHTIRDEIDLEKHLEYIHYNPVKHGLVSCPHLWEYSSFHQWVKRKVYPVDWSCVCCRKETKIPDFSEIAATVGE